MFSPDLDLQILPPPLEHERASPPVTTVPDITLPPVPPSRALTYSAAGISARFELPYRHRPFRCPSSSVQIFSSLAKGDLPGIEAMSSETRRDLHTTFRKQTSRIERTAKFSATHIRHLSQIILTKYTRKLSLIRCPFVDFENDLHLISDTACPHSARKR